MPMRRRSMLSLAGIGLVLAGCGSTQSAMPYAPTRVPVQVGRPLVTVGTVTDSREGTKDDPNWIGTIRGGFGNPIKRLEAEGPVSGVIAQAFRDGLAARGMLAGGAGRYRMDVDIIRFDADQVGRREATAEFRVSLHPAAGGGVVFSRTARANQISGSALTFSAGVFGSVEELRGIALSTMNEAVDQALDDPALAAALR